jgi:hypothetical protein
MSDDGMVETKIYVQLDPKRGHYSRKIEGMRPVAMTTGKPESLRGRIVVGLTLRLPASVFEPLEPSAVITLDEGSIIRRETLEVDALPSDDDE